MSFVLTLVVEVERDYGMFFAKRPPPAEAREAGEYEARVASSSKSLDEIEDSVEGLFRSSVVRTDGDVAAEFENGGLLAAVEAGLLQDHHALRFPEYVVVERALRDPVLGRGLGEPHLLGDHRLYRVLEVVTRPGRCLQLQQGRIVG